MSTFRALMAISASQTKEAQGAVQEALALRQRNEELRQKQREEQERKEKELARQLRLKYFEDEKKERERQQRLEQERLAKAAALQKREEDAKNALRYGPKKAKSLSSTPDTSSPKWPASSSQSRARAEVRKRRVPGEDGDDDAGGATPDFLTREEKRERKQALELKKLFQSNKRSSSSGNHSSRAGRRLPGGAVDMTTSMNLADGAPAANKSVKERLAAMPNTLTKLNTVKRDTRTIDEILQDRAKAREVKILDGDDARGFDDWFVSPKKKEPVTKKLSPPRQQSTTSTATPGANTPAPQGSKTGTPTPQSSNPVKKTTAPAKTSTSLLKSTSSKNTPAGHASSKSSVPSRPLPSDKHSSVTSKPCASSDAPPARKRPRSPSLSDSPPPPKKHFAGSNKQSEIRNEIWKIMGRDRSAYVSRDVFSDDEDMEADATILEREEKQSARIAKREDILALEEERRREEEKRRRKKEATKHQRRN